MVVRKRKKILKRRGQRSPGHGSQKKHRGGGSRGGRGLAGLHKHKRFTSLKYMPDHFGKRGFKRPYSVRLKTINVSQLEDLVVKKGLKGKINLSDLGYDKLLGSGKVRTKMDVTAKHFSDRARKKIEEIGGKIND